LDIERLATGERFTLRTKGEWTGRLARDAGY